MVIPVRELLRFVIIYLAIYGAFGVASPFWPRFFETRGLNSEEIGLLFGLGAIVRLIVAPCAGRVADRLQSHRLILGLCAFLAAAASLALLAVNEVKQLFFVQLLEAAALAPITILADALAVTAARRDHFEYGRVRGAASAAFVIGLIAAGRILDLYGFPAVVAGYATLLAAAGFAVGLVSPVEPPATKDPVPPWSLLAGIRVVLGDSRFRSILLGAALIYGSHAMHDTFGIIRWTSAGISASEASILWSESVAAEVIVFFLLGPVLVNRLGVGGAIALTATAGVARWTIMAETTNLAVLAAIQPLHGLTFALTHLACMRFIASGVPVRLAATAQGLYLFAPALLTGLLTIASGELYARFGAQGFLFMALICGAAVPVGLRLRLDAAVVQSESQRMGQ
jgi:PPP family 3-phenylpropionic acid transporter